MSNAINFSNMPVNYGLLYAFDCNTYVDGATTWDNSVLGGIAATVVNGTVFMDGAVLLAKSSGFAYWVNSEEYQDSTKYFIAKVSNVTSKTTHYSTFTERRSSTSYTTDIDVYGSGSKFSLYCNGSTSTTSTVSTDYHIVAVTKSGTTGTIYVDGEKIAEITGKTAFIPTNYGIGTSSTTGNTPTTNSTGDVYVKCALVCNAAHSAGEILENSNWLLEQYGLKSPEKDSRLAGTDDVAIAYAIARNQEIAAALQDMKKAYQQGMLNGNGDTTPDYENDDPTPPGLVPIIDENDPEKSDNTAVVGDDGVVDMENGLWHIYTDDNGNITGYVHLYFDGYVYTTDSGKGYYTTYRRNYPHCDVYNASGALVWEGDYSSETSGNGPFAYRCDRGIVNGVHGEKTQEFFTLKYYLKGNKACRDYRKIVYGGVLPSIDFATSDVYSFSGISGSYSKCSNRKPF